MKNLFLSCIALLLTLSIVGQNWQSVHSSTVYAYELNEFLATDSTWQSGPDSVFHLYSLFRPNDDPFTSLLATEPNYFGETVIIQPNGINHFLNHQGDSLNIHTWANLGDTTRFYTYASGAYIDLVVDSLDTLTFLGIQDSVKTYRMLTYADVQGTPTLNRLTDQTLQLSQSHGLVRLFQFHDFPNPQPTLSDSTIFRNLVGYTDDQQQLGLQNLTQQEIATFQVGDILHVKDLCYVPSFCDHNHEQICEILTANINTNNTLYEYTVHVWQFNPDFLRLEEFTTTWTFNIDPNHLLNQLPGTLDTTNSFGTPTYYHQLPGPNGRIEKRWVNTGFNINWDSHIDGLGGTYYDHQTGHPVFSSQRFLMYFEKGGETWGIPYQLNEWRRLSLSLGWNDLQSWDSLPWPDGYIPPGPDTLPDPTLPQFQAFAYPNPANDQAKIQIELPGPGIAKARIIDVQGRTIWTQVVDMDKAGIVEFPILPLKLRYGMYHLWVTYEDLQYLRKFTVLNIGGNTNRPKKNKP